MHILSSYVEKISIILLKLLLNLLQLQFAEQAQKMKEARRERDENAPNTLLGLRLRLVESKIDRKQEIPKEKKKKPAAFGIASLFGGGRKK